MKPAMPCLRMSRNLLGGAMGYPEVLCSNTGAVLPIGERDGDHPEVPQCGVNRHPEVSLVLKLIKDPRSLILVTGAEPGTPE